MIEELLEKLQRDLREVVIPYGQELSIEYDKKASRLKARLQINGQSKELPIEPAVFIDMKTNEYDRKQVLRKIHKDLLNEFESTSP